MFSYKKTFDLTIAGHKFSVSSSQDLDVALAGRTNPSPYEVIRLMKCSQKVLVKLAEKNKEVRGRVYEIIARCSENDKLLHSRFRSLNFDSFYLDNNWQSFLKSLMEDDGLPGQVIRIALLNYIQYLTNYNTIIEFMAPRKANGSDNMAGTQEISSDGTLKINTNGFFGNHTRLRKNFPVKVNFPKNRKFSILLSFNKCRLITRAPWVFIGPDKKEHTIDIGKYSIGRNPDNDIVLNSSLQDISRTHLIIDRIGEDVARIMDVSTLGTYLPDDVLADYMTA